MVGLVQGDLGTYGANSASVADRIASALPVTLQLTFMGLIIAVVLAVILGVISALYRDRWPDQVIRIFSIAFIATPSFWLAVLLILLFSSMLQLLPASGPLPSFTSGSRRMDGSYGHARVRSRRSRYRPAYARYPYVHGRGA